MKTLFSSLFLFAFSLNAHGAANFVPGPEGETVSDVELDLVVLPAFSWVSDPFLKVPGRSRAPASTSSEETEYTLQATTLEGEDSVAVVNDRVVRVGDQVGHRTVMKIGRDFVLLGDRGSVIEATLEENTADQKREPAASKTNKSVEPEGRIKIEELKK